MISIKKILYEVLNNYSVEVDLFVDRSSSTYDVTNEIRALQGVTIVTIITPEDYTQSGDDDVTSPRNTITDLSNVPYKRPTYEFINSPGRQWIRKYTLALSKEMLGSIRGKYQSVTITGDTATLDYSRLLSEASAEKLALIEQLREDLEATTTLRQAERRTLESEQTQQQYTVDNPYQIYIH